MTPEERAARKVQREAQRVKDVERAKRVAEQDALNERLRLAQLERQRLAKLPKTLRCVNGGLVDVPVYDDHHRAKNWAAVVDIDPVRPGGLQRTWFERGNGPCFYILPRLLTVGHVVEFGADYVTSVGRRKPLRWFGVVIELTSEHVIIQPYEDIVDALTTRRTA
jgi:hypothetical protein